MGILILKRRAYAERDGDRIYAVIQGIGLARDGESEGVAAERASGLARATRKKNTIVDRESTRHGDAGRGTRIRRNRRGPSANLSALPCARPLPT